MKTGMIRVFLLAALYLAAGCRDGNERLSGRVRFPDGSPLTTGTIYFTNDNYTARAHLRPDGVYVVGSVKETDGLAPGTYKVSIIGAVERTGGESDNDWKPLIASEFASEEQTPLSVTIPGTRVFDITVERASSK